MITTVKKTELGKLSVKLSKPAFIEFAAFLNKCRKGDEAGGFLQSPPQGPAIECRVMALLVKEVHNRCAKLFIHRKDAYTLTMSEAEALAAVWNFRFLAEGHENWISTWDIINKIHQKLS